MQSGEWEMKTDLAGEALPGRGGDREERILLSRLIESSEKQLFYERARTVISVISAIAIVCALVLVVPAILRTVSNVDGIISQASETIALADDALTGITQMSESITDMGQNMDAFILENEETVSRVMEQLEAVDFEGLNRAIRDLGDVVEPFAKFFNKF